MSSEAFYEFITVECQAFCDRVADGTHDSPKESQDGKRLITSKNVKGGRLELETAYKISLEDFEEINRRSQVHQWDLLLTMIGTVGEVCVVDDSEPDFAIKNVGLLKCGSELKAKWLYYFLRSPKGKTLIEERKKGSTQQYISLAEIRKLPISYPNDPARMQLVIDTLASFDDRISTLRETNANLEAIAQTLFNSWFVDFDPVRAKIEGRVPEGMDEATAALFPDSFEELELGAVPRGWSFKRLDEVSDVGIGKTPPRKEPEWFSETGEDVPWVSIRDMGSSGVYIANTTEFLVAQAIDRFNVRRVPDNTVLLSFKLTVGRVSITDGEMTTNEAIAHCKLGSEAPLPTEFIYLYLKQFNFGGLGSTSSIAEAVNSKTIKSIPIIVPSDEIVSAFNRLISGIFQRLKESERQAKTLADLRDTLLPRLISSQLGFPVD